MPSVPLRSELPDRWGPRAYLEARLGGLFRRAAEPAETARGERVYAIGDVHGRLDLLRRLLRAIEADASRDADGGRTRIVILGDLVDRGPHSRQVLELLRFLERRDPERLVVLPGNHEDMLLASTAGDAEAQRVWLKTGGDATLRSYRLDPAEFTGLSPAERGRVLRRTVGTDMIGWLEARPLAHQSGDYFFCHAGVRPGVPLNKQRREDLLWIRREFLGSDRSHGAVIVHGHSVTDEAQVAHNRINVDTGAHRSGELTAVGLQGPCRWFLSTTRTILHRTDLDAAREWSQRDPGVADQPATKSRRRRSKSAPLPDAEAA